MRKILFSLTLCMLLAAGCGDKNNQVKKEETGAQKAGREAGAAMREVGKTAKEVGKEIGKGVKDFGKAFSDAFTKNPEKDAQGTD